MRLKPIAVRVQPIAVRLQPIDNSGPTPEQDIGMEVMKTLR